MATAPGRRNSVRLANLGGRAIAIEADGRYVDLAESSGGRIPSDPMAALGLLPYLTDRVQIPEDAPRVDPAMLDAPVPRPSKILGAGVNYHDHAAETKIAVPSEPVLFAKLPSAVTSAYSDIVLGAQGAVDWEAEIVVVIGRDGRNIPEADAWSYVAGLTIGQDISDRPEQFRDFAQFTIGKSFDTYAPIGPWIVTPDEFAAPDDIAIRCMLNGEEVQRGRTSQCIFSVAELVSWTSRACTLKVGDLIFTGTPPGVGYSRTPARFLADGDVLETVVEGIGAMRNVCRIGVAV